MNYARKEYHKNEGWTVFKKFFLEKVTEDKKVQ
jgi:hypothetical protein